MHRLFSLIQNEEATKQKHYFAYHIFKHMPGYDLISFTSLCQ